MNRLEKQDLVNTLNANLGGIETVVVAHYKGLTVAEVTQLRRAMRAQGGVMKVAKNSLVKLALKGTQYESLSSLFTGPTAIFYSTDPVAPAKIVSEFANDNDNLVIVGGAMGASVLDAEGVKQLAKMPSLNELRAKIIGVISAPATKLATILQTPAGQLARVFGAYAAK
jgi:large subunit ribosomal protein L10